MKFKRLLLCFFLAACLLVGLLLRPSSKPGSSSPLPSPQPQVTAPSVPVSQSPPSEHKPAREPSLSREAAVICALNHITTESDQTVRVKHPLHTADFTTKGLTFTPARSEQAWKWTLRHFGTEVLNLISPDARQLPAKPVGLRSVAYSYGLFTEIYHGKEQTLEQCFVLEEAPQLSGKDLVIRGEVSSKGQFESDDDHRWQWRDLSNGVVVSLGNVTVYDAEGDTIPATMSVSASSTEITVNGPLLAAATFPVTVDPEIGTNDFVISDAAVGGSVQAYSVDNPNACYNPDTNTYLFVWFGASEERTFEVLGQHVNATTGDPVGDILRISQNGLTIFDLQIKNHSSPVAVYNTTSQEYLVAWDQPTTLGGVGSRKIFAQRLDRFGNETGDDDFELTPVENGRSFKLAYNATSQRYAICWRRTDMVRAQILNATGGLEGETAFPIAPALFESDSVDVAANTSDGGFLFAFKGVTMSGGDDSLYTQKVDSNGLHLSSSPAVVASGLDNAIDDIAIAESIATGGYAIVWNQDREDSSIQDPWLALLDSNGGVVSTPTKLGEYADSVDVAASPDGMTYLATWEGSVPDQTLASIATVNATNGNVVSNFNRPISPDADSVAILTAGGPPSQPTVVMIEIRQTAVPDIPERSTHEVFAAIIPLPHGNTPTLSWRQVSQRQLIVDPNPAAVSPDVAYDDARDRYVVVWNAYEMHSGSSTWANIVPSNGITLGGGARLSEQGTESEPRYTGNPKIVFNSRDENFMIVWAGTWNPSDPYDYEIFAQRFFRGPHSETNQPSQVPGIGKAQSPRIAYNYDHNEYLVAWIGNPDPINWDIYGQRINTFGQEVGPDDFRITTSGADYLSNYHAASFDIAFSAASEMYAIAYSAADPIDDPFTGTIIPRNGVFLQGVSRDGVLTIPFQQSVSSSADPYARVSIANRPDPNDGFLIVWDGGVNEERAIFGQHVDGLRDTTALLGSPFRISTPLTEHAFAPVVEHNEVRDEFMVSWSTNTFEGARIIARPVKADGLPIGESMDLRSGSGHTSGATSITHNAQGHYLSVWGSLQDRGYLADSAGEIFGQHFRTAYLEVTSMVLDGNDCILHIDHQPGLQYRVQTSSDLRNWINATGVLISAPSGTNVFIDEGAMSQNAKFYRVEQPNELSGGS